MGAVQTFAEDTGGKAIGGVVGTANDFCFVIKGEYRHYWAEDLFTHDAHFVGTVGEHGRRCPGAIGKAASVPIVAAYEQASALLLAQSNIRKHFLLMFKANQRAEVDAGIHRVACFDALNALHQLGFKGVFNAAFNKHPCAVGANLAAGVEVGHHGGVGGAVKVGICKDQQRRFAA